MDAPEGLAEFLRYHRRLFLVMGGVCLAVTVLLLALLPSESGWGWGYAIGAAAQLAKFGLLDVAVVKRMAKNREEGVLSQVKVRYLALVILAAAAALVYVLRLKIVAMAAGVLTPTVILVMDSLVRPNVFGQTEGGTDSE